MGSRIVSVLVFGCWAVMSNAAPFVGVPYRSDYQAKPEVGHMARSDNPSLNSRINEILSKTDSYILATPSGTTHVNYSSSTATAYNAISFSKEYPHLHKAAVEAQNYAIRASNNGIESRRAEKQREQEWVCLTSDEFKAYREGADVVSSVSVIKTIEGEIARNSRVERASGTRNLTRRYELHNLLELTRRSRDSSYSQYKKMGGIATNPAFVERLNINPCARLTPVVAEDPIPSVDESNWVPEIYSSENVPLDDFQYPVRDPSNGIVPVIALVKPDGSVDAFLENHIRGFRLNRKATQAVERMSYKMDSNVEGIPKAFFVYIPVIYNQDE